MKPSPLYSLGAASNHFIFINDLWAIQIIPIRFFPQFTFVYHLYKTQNIYVCQAPLWALPDYKFILQQEDYYFYLHFLFFIFITCIWIFHSCTLVWTFKKENFSMYFSCSNMLQANIYLRISILRYSKIVNNYKSEVKLEIYISTIIFEHTIQYFSLRRWDNVEAQKLVRKLNNTANKLAWLSFV